MTFLDALNGRRARALRWLSPGVVVDLLTATGPPLHAHLAALDLFRSGEPVSWAGAGPAPTWLDVAREFTERWTASKPRWARWCIAGCPARPAATGTRPARAPAERLLRAVAVIG